ncbi:MAG: hypothetical protein WCP59_14120 [Actinomycetota bacterium]
MFTTGSKLFIGATTLSLAATIVVGSTTSGGAGSLATIGLISLTVALAFLTGIVVFVRDANVRGVEPGATTASAAAQSAPAASMWPLVSAVGLLLIGVGLITAPVVFKAGLVVLFAAAAEWMIQGWSERASASASYNTEVRRRILFPLEFPVLGAVIGAVVVYSFSRIMLYLTKEAGPVVFIVVASLILVGGILFAVKPKLSKGFVGGVCAVAMLALVGTGVATAVSGQRSIHEHATISNDPGVCSSAEETEIDHKSSQSVAAKSNTTATVYLQDGQLSAQVLGITERQQTITIPRSNISHIVFRNLDAEPARLTASLGTFTKDVNGTQVTEKPVTCTALVEQDGRQFLTLKFPKSSAASQTPYTFTVPGVEGSSIEIVVP